MAKNKDEFESNGLLDWVLEIEAQRSKRKDQSAKIKAMTTEAKISETLENQVQPITKLNIKLNR